MNIDNDLLDALKEIFVTRKECDDINATINAKLGNDNARFAKIEQKLGSIEWMIKAVLTSVIGLVVASIYKLIIGG